MTNSFPKTETAKKIEIIMEELVLKKLEELKRANEDMDDMMVTIYDHCCDLYLMQDQQYKETKKKPGVSMWAEIPMGTNPDPKYREGMKDMAREIIQLIRSGAPALSYRVDMERRNGSVEIYGKDKKIEPKGPISKERIPSEVHLCVDHEQPEDSSSSP